jgi:hypothetical protein
MCIMPSCNSKRPRPSGAPPLSLPSSLRLLNQLNRFSLPIRLARINLLPRLLDRFEDCFVGEVGRGDDGCRLGVEGDVVGFYACEYQTVSVSTGRNTGGGEVEGR